MQHTRVRPRQPKAISKPFARYARAAILAHPQLVLKIAHKLRRPTLLRPALRRPSSFGS
jgi:hypothetical protein